MLPGPIVVEGVQAIAGKISEIFERTGAVEQPETIKSTILYVSRQPAAALAVPDAFGFPIKERTNHKW